MNNSPSGRHDGRNLPCFVYTIFYTLKPVFSRLACSTLCLKATDFQVNTATLLRFLYCKTGCFQNAHISRSEGWSTSKIVYEIFVIFDFFCDFFTSFLRFLIFFEIFLFYFFFFERKCTRFFRVLYPSSRSVEALLKFGSRFLSSARKIRFTERIETQKPSVCIWLFTSGLNTNSLIWWEHTKPWNQVSQNVKSKPSIVSFKSSFKNLNVSNICRCKICS